MLAIAVPPPLTPIQSSSLEGRMKNGSHSEFVVGEFAQENRAKLEELEQRRNDLTIKAAIMGFGGAVGLAVFTPAAIAALIGSIPVLDQLLGQLQTISQRYLLMLELIEAFEKEDVAIEVGLKPSDLREIDFFLRFTDKEYILIQIRSLGDAKVTYSEEREALRFRKKGGGSKTWEPDPLFELAEQERWLRRQRYDLLGQSARDRRRPLAKLLVLWQETVLGDHPEHLYVTMDDQKYLTIRKMGTTALVTKNQVIDFIRGYLASRRSRKTS